MSLSPAIVGYLAAAVLFLLLAAAVLTTWRQRFRGSSLALATLATAGWGAALAWSADAAHFSGDLLFAAEFLLDAAWLLFLASLLAGGLMTQRVWVVRNAGVLLALAILALGLLAAHFQALRAAGVAPGDVLVFGSILTSLYALVSIEQIYRNARDNQTAELKHLCLGLAAIFGIDLFLYSNAFVSGELSAVLWEARGFVVAMCAPLVALSVHRRRGHSRGLFMSRRVIFYTATLVAAGVYFLVISAAGYLVRNFGLDWSGVLQIVLLASSILLFVALAMSERLRARLRVYIVKHFFESKYDYREEWLKLNRTLNDSASDLPLRKRAIEALANIVGSAAGTLWLAAEPGDDYVPVAAWNMRAPAGVLAHDGPFPSFLRSKGWVVDVEDLLAQPDRYAQADGSEVSTALGDIRIVVPLVQEGRLVGLVGLTAPKNAPNFNFEDHDLLKTAGNQVAGYLVQEAATERLAESRQFEAFNRLTAYVMHDLKNAVAQQSLVVKNAEKHKRNPEFIDDAIETIKGSIGRIRNVVTQLQQGVMDTHADRADLGKLILQAISMSADRKPVPVARLPDERLFALVDKDRLQMALCHAIRNAQDATPADGTIEVRLTTENGACVIGVRDTGQGMTAEFVRERLFRPFDSTKGTQGMGIGAYQIRETVRAAGGDVRVESAPEAGTTLYLTLPRTA